MRKLRLIMTTDCDRACLGCCNQQWDMKKLPRVGKFHDYDRVMITGGEPMLYEHATTRLAQKIKHDNPDAEVIVYTAKTDKPEDLIRLLYTVDGLTVTLHETEDVEPFNNFARMLSRFGPMRPLSLRLNIFAEVDETDLRAPMRWQIKNGIEWIEDCPLPEGETLAMLKVGDE